MFIGLGLDSTTGINLVPRGCTGIGFFPILLQYKKAHTSVKTVEVLLSVEGECHGILGQAQGEGQDISFPSLRRVTHFQR